MAGWVDKESARRGATCRKLSEMASTGSPGRGSSPSPTSKAGSRLALLPDASCRMVEWCSSRQPVRNSIPSRPRCIGGRDRSSQTVPCPGRGPLRRAGNSSPGRRVRASLELCHTLVRILVVIRLPRSVVTATDWRQRMSPPDTDACVWGVAWGRPGCDGRRRARCAHVADRPVEGLVRCVAGAGDAPSAAPRRRGSGGCTTRHPVPARAAVHEGCEGRRRARGRCVRRCPASRTH